MTTEELKQKFPLAFDTIKLPVRYVGNLDGKSYHVCHSALGDYPTPPFKMEGE